MLNGSTIKPLFGDKDRHQSLKYVKDCKLPFMSMPFCFVLWACTRMYSNCYYSNFSLHISQKLQYIGAGPWFLYSKIDDQNSKYVFELLIVPPHQFLIAVIMKYLPVSFNSDSVPDICNSNQSNDIVWIGGGEERTRASQAWYFHNLLGLFRSQNVEFNCSVWR